MILEGCTFLQSLLGNVIPLFVSNDYVSKKGLESLVRSKLTTTGYFLYIFQSLYTFILNFAYRVHWKCLIIDYNQVYLYIMLSVLTIMCNHYIFPILACVSLSYYSGLPIVRVLLNPQMYSPEYSAYLKVERSTLPFIVRVN